MADDVEALLLGDFAGDERAVGLERVDGCHVVALLRAERGAVDMALARLDRAAVDDDRRPVVAHRGHEAAGHVLVAARDRDVAVVVLALDHRLDRVGDDVATRQPAKRIW